MRAERQRLTLDTPIPSTLLAKAWGRLQTMALKIADLFPPIPSYSHRLLQR